MDLWGDSEAMLRCFVGALCVSATAIVTAPCPHRPDRYSVVQNICDSKPDNKYILAVDDSKNTLEEIVRVFSCIVSMCVSLLSVSLLQAISSTLANGKVRKVAKDQLVMENLVKVRIGGWFWDDWVGGRLCCCQGYGGD